MKRSVALVALAFFLTGILPLTAQAQLGEGIDIKPGVRAGVDFMTFWGDDVDGDETNRRTGILVGGFLLADFAGPFAVQPELMYIQKGVSEEGTLPDGTTVTTNTKLGYIEVPLLVKLQAPLGEGITPSVFAGPTLGLNVTGEVELEVEGEGVVETTDADNVNTAELGLVLGGGIDIDFSVGTLMGDIRYGLGLTDVIEDGDVSGRNRGFMITAGLAVDLSSVIQ